MPNTESEVIQTILKRGGKAKKGAIVKELGISLGYLDIITRSLERRGLVKFSNNVYFLTSSGKKKLAEFVQKKKKVKLGAKKKRGRPRGKWHPKEQKADPPVVKVNGQLTSLDGETDSTKNNSNPETKEPSVEALLGQRIGELKEGVAEAEKKIEEGLENIEKKIEKELEKKLETVEEKTKPAVEEIKELPPTIVRFSKFLFFVSKRIFNKCKKIKDIKFPKLQVLSIRQNIDKEKWIPKTSLIFTKLRDFKVQDKLIYLPVWISKNYKNLTKKKN